MSNNLYLKTSSKCTATSHNNCIIEEGYISVRKKRTFDMEPEKVKVFKKLHTRKDGPRHSSL